MNSRERLLFTFSFVLIIILIYSNYKNRNSDKYSSCINNHHGSRQKDNLRDEYQYWTDLFAEIGKRHGTDKISSHSYQNVYGHFLGPLREKEINFLEIGIGCSPGQIPGLSILLWKEYIPNIKLSMLEYNGTCAEQFRSQLEHLFIGDQSDFDLLNKIGKVGPFDVVVDDGGHSRRQQINSLIGLWPYLKSKGVYIIEDIMFSFTKEFNDNENESIFDVISQLFFLFNDPSPFPFKSIYPDKEISNEIRKVFQDLLSINCYLRVCALIKKVSWLLFIFYCWGWTILDKNKVTLIEFN